MSMSVTQTKVILFVFTIKDGSILALFGNTYGS